MRRRQSGMVGYRRASGISRVTITEGLKEITREGYQSVETVRCRKEGGGRKLVEQNNPEILKLIEKLLEPHTKGDPMNPLKWTSKSMRALECECGVHSQRHDHCPDIENARLFASGEQEGISHKTRTS
jgi:hypothetical protein